MTISLLALARASFARGSSASAFSLLGGVWAARQIMADLVHGLPELGLEPRLVAFSRLHRVEWQFLSGERGVCTEPLTQARAQAASAGLRGHWRQLGLLVEYLFQRSVRAAH